MESQTHLTPQDWAGEGEGGGGRGREGEVQ